MRSLLDELEDRLDDAKRRRREELARHASEMEVIAKDEQIVVKMLELERSLLETHASGVSATDNLRAGATNALENAILAALSNEEEWDHQELKAYLVRRGFGNDDATFGRSLQGTLLSMRGRELIDLVGTGRWQCVPQEEETAVEEKVDGGTLYRDRRR